MKPYNRALRTPTGFGSILFLLEEFRALSTFIVSALSYQYRMQVICLEDSAFYALVEEVVHRVREKQNIQGDKWISGEEAMQKLRITSKSTLQKLRDEGKIRYSQPMPKVILYDSDSITGYLERYAKNTF